MVVFIFFLIINLKGNTQNKLKQNNSHSVDGALFKETGLKLKSP